MTTNIIIKQLSNIRETYKELFKLDGLEEEIAIIVLGIGGIIALILNRMDIASFCFGAVAGYLAKGYKEAQNGN
jgi:uncharacterized membrane protein